MGGRRGRFHLPGTAPRIGIALGGGAARGMAHLGVLRVLEEHGCAPDVVAGTSIGALFGGLWAVLGDAADATERVREFVASDEYRRTRVEFLKEEGEDSGWAESFSNVLRKGLVLGWTYFRESFISEEDFRHNVEVLLPDLRIEDLRLPFCAAATDLVSRRSVFFRRGSLREAVLASGAVPALMPPRRIGHRLLVDGAVTEKVPARALLSMDVDLILAVDVSTEVFESSPLESGAEIITRSKQVTEWHLRQSRLASCDLIVRPEVADVHWLDFSGALPAVERGAEAMEAALPALERLLLRRRWRGPWGRGAVDQGRRMDEAGLLGEPAEEI